MKVSADVDGTSSAVDLTGDEKGLSEENSEEESIQGRTRQESKEKTKKNSATETG